MATADQKKLAKVDEDGHAIASISAPRLPYHPAIEERFGIDKASWKALVEAIFPGATSTESVILALSYCRARRLDPFKRVVHIVPIWSKEKKCMVDTVWPGIGELRTTAFRTGEYAGRGETVFGMDVERRLGNVDMVYPEWAQVTVRRMIRGQIVEFAGPRVYWEETYATASRNDESPNDMWKTRPRGQLEKCAEAAALRAAFPEEIGSDYIAEEVQHHATGHTFDVIPDKPRTVEDLMASKAIPAISHTGPMPSDEQLADEDEGQEAEPEPEQDEQQKASNPGGWRSDKWLPDGLLVKLESAVKPEAVEAIRVDFLAKNLTHEQLEALTEACQARTAELEASKAAKGGKKQQRTLV